MTEQIVTVEAEEETSRETKKEYVSSVPMWKRRSKERFSVEFIGYTPEISDLTQKPKNKNTLWFILGIAFSAVAIVILIYNDVQSGNMTPVWDAYQVIGQNIIWLFLCILAYVAALMMDGLAFSSLFKIASGKFQLGLGVRIHIIGQYYNNITPLAVGGQPFQIHTLTKEGMSVGKASSVVISRYSLRQLVFNFLMLGFLIFAPVASVFSQLDPVAANLIKVGAYIGLVFMMAIPTFLIFVALSKKAGERIVHGILIVLYKLKIVRKFDKTKRKIMAQVENYRVSLRFFFSKKLTFITQIILNLVEFFALISIPYFVYRMFGGEGEQWVTVIALFIYATLAVSFIPTPGGAGAADFSGSFIFGVLLTASGFAFWAVISWRLFTFYIFILVGIIYFINRGINKFFLKRQYRKQSENQLE